MRGETDTTGIREQGSYILLPEGEYYVEITEIIDQDKAGNQLVSKNGDPMVKIKLTVCAGIYQDEGWIWDRIVISNNPASKGYGILGRSKHFLHCIKQEYEGKFSWDSEKWLYQKCKIKVTHEAPNEYHKNKKAIVENYILEEDFTEPDL